MTSGISFMTVMRPPPSAGCHYSHYDWCLLRKSAETWLGAGAFPAMHNAGQHGLARLRNHRLLPMAKLLLLRALSTLPVPLAHAILRRQELIKHAEMAWRQGLLKACARKHGYRNAQVSVICPDRSIGWSWIADTTGIEPDFALGEVQKLAGGGLFSKIINRACTRKLCHIGYGEADIAEIEAYAVGNGSWHRHRASNHSTLKPKGFTDERSAQ